MSIRHGANEPSSFYIGNNAVSRIYRGSQQVWPASTLATVTTQTSITHSGVTFTFDRPMQTCVSCLGEPAVISTEAFAITSITPAAATISGGSGDFVGNGAMQDPDLLSSEQQGFDALLADNSAPGQSVSNTTYNSTLNVDPAINGAIAISAGETTSIVKSVRLSGVTAPGDASWQAIDRYVVLSVLSSVPPNGFFRPGMTVGTKTIYGSESDVNYGVLRSETALSGIPTQASAEAAIEPTLPYFGLSNGEKLRRFDVEGGSNYSRDFGLSRADAHAFLHTDASNSAKRLTFLRSIQHGIDLAQAQANGYQGFGGAGQNYGRSFFSYVAAFALNNATLLSAAQAMGGGALRQHFWATADTLEGEVDFPAGSSDSHRNESPLLQSDLNIPEWDRDPFDARRRDASPNSRYRLFWPVGLIEALNVTMLQNGPGGISGANAALGGGAFDETNPLAAGVAFYDRARNWPIALGIAIYGQSTDRFARYDAWRPLIGLTPWTGRPDWVTGDGQVSAGDGQITYDWSDHQWATEPITRRDIRYSLDGRQWVEQLGVAATGTLTSLTRGLDHQVGFRLVSASGAGRWSPTYPGSGPSGASPNMRNTVAPTGSTAAAAPVNTVTPQIMVRELEDWPGSDMVSVGSTFTTTQRDNFVVLYAGVGYWTGFPAPTFSYEWRANGVPISGATSDSFDPKNRFDLSEAVITCVITADDGSNQVSATTQSVTLPTIASPLPYVSDFALGDASADWAGTRSASVAYNGANDRLDVTLGDAFSGATAGPIAVINGSAVVVTIVFENPSGGLENVVIGSTADGDNLHTSSNLGGSGERTYQTTITPNVDEIYVTLRRRGSASGQMMYISRLEVALDVPDTTAPVLSSPTASANGATAYTGSVTTDEDNGTLYWLVNTSSSTPSVVAVQAGNSQAVSSTGAQAILGSGLTASTTYYIHYVQTDDASNDSNVVTTTSFTTAALDVTAPVLSSASAAAAGATGYSGSVSTNEGNGTLYWLVNTSSSTPSVTAVQAGNSQAVSGTGSQAVSGSGLTASTTYYIHYVHTDDASNDSTVVSTSSFTTDAPSGLTVLQRTPFAGDGSFTNSHQVTLPGGIVDGSFLVLAAVIGNQGTTLSVPSGWTESAVISSSESRTHILTRTASGDSGATVTLGYNFSTTFTAIFYEVNAPVGSLDIASNISGTNPPSLTPAAGSNEYIWLAGAITARANRTATAGPTSYGNVQSVRTTSSSTSSGHASFAMADKLATASSDDPDEFTWNVAPVEDASFTIAIR